MMSQRIFLSRFCATLSAGALALALASPAWSADPAGQAEMQLAKNHINSLKKPSPALSGKALQAFQKAEKAFQAHAKQKTPNPKGPKAMPALSGKALQAFQKAEKAFQAHAKQKPTKPLNRKQVKDLCKKDKTCREQMIFIEKEKKKKKSGSLDFGLPDLASALNPFHVKEAQAAHLPLLSWPTYQFSVMKTREWFVMASMQNISVRSGIITFRSSGTPDTSSYRRDLVMVPKTGWYLYTFKLRSSAGASIAYYVDNILVQNRSFGASLDPQVFQWWSYLARGRHSLRLHILRGGLNYEGGALEAHG